MAHGAHDSAEVCSSFGFINELQLLALAFGILGQLARLDADLALGKLTRTRNRHPFTKRHRTGASEKSGDSGDQDPVAADRRARQLSGAEAKRVVDQLLQDRSATLDALAREELGIDPKELGGSAREAAITSFLLFATGAIVPIVPFMVGAGSAAVVASLALSAVALFAIGAAITIFTGVPVCVPEDGNLCSV